MRSIMGWLALGLALAVPAAGGAQFMSVQVQQGQMRATPSFLGQVVANLPYGSQVEALNQQGPWTQVRAGGRSGWMHQSALTRKRIAMNAGQRDAQVAASGSELALAGKGFNSDVEAQFKANNRNVDFSWVDRMEKIKVSATEAAAFLRVGGLSGGAP